MINRKLLIILICLFSITAFHTVLLAQRRTAAIDPLERLMNEYIVNGNLTKLEELRQLIMLQRESEPENPIGYFLSGKLEKALGNSEKAVELWEKALTLDVKYPRLYKALSEAYLDSGDGDRFTETYYTWLETETDTKALNREFELAELAMPFEKKQEFAGLAIEEKIPKLLVYWRKLDPYPVSDMNERLVAHVKRIQYALDKYGSQYGNFGFDDRGKVYIRYGEPELKYDLRRMHDFPVRNNESWYYPSYHLYMAFDFVDFGGGHYREVNSLLDALPGQNDIDEVRQLYAEREELGGMYAMSEVQTPVGYIRDVPQEKRRVQRTVDPKFQIELDMQDLEYAYRIAQFRGKDEDTRVEIAYGIPLGQLKPNERNGAEPALDFKIDVVLLDSLYRRSGHLENLHSVSLPAERSNKDISFISDEKYEAPSGLYEQTFQILEMFNRKGSFTTAPLTVRNFTGNDFKMSDLKFSQSLGERELLAVQEGGELNPLPYPFNSLERKKPVWLYFEVYNLLLEPNAGSKYRITMSIFPVKEDGSVFLKPFRKLGRLFGGGGREIIETVNEREGNERTAKEYFQLDMADVKKGRSRLLISVEDLVGNSAAKDSIDFELK